MVKYCLVWFLVEQIKSGVGSSRERSNLIVYWKSKIKNDSIAEGKVKPGWVAGANQFISQTM